MAQIAVSELMGIGGIQSPSYKEQLMNVSGISGNYQPSSQNVSSTAPQSSSVDLQKELAQIQAMRQSQGGGIGQTTGGLLGTGAGAALTGGSPMGMALGQAAGSSIGSIVDYIINSDDAERANRKREQALLQEQERQKAMKASDDFLRAQAQRKGIALSREEEAMNEQDVINQMRRSTMTNILSRINQQAQNDDFLRNKFLKTRSVL